MSQDSNPLAAAVAREVAKLKGAAAARAAPDWAAVARQVGENLARAQAAPRPPAMTQEDRRAIQARAGADLAAAVARQLATLGKKPIGDQS